VAAVISLPGSVVQLHRSLRDFRETLVRLDRLVRRLDLLTEPLEGPLEALTPRLEAMARLLDEDQAGSMGAVLEAWRRRAHLGQNVAGQASAPAAGHASAPAARQASAPAARQAAPSIAASVERLVASMDGGLARLQDLSAAALIDRLRVGAQPARPTDDADAAVELGDPNPPAAGAAGGSEPGAAGVNPAATPAPEGSDPGARPDDDRAGAPSPRPGWPRTSSGVEEHRSWRG
jgi:hypothetical protein